MLHRPQIAWPGAWLGAWAPIWLDRHAPARDRGLVQPCPGRSARAPQTVGWTGVSGTVDRKGATMTDLNLGGVTSANDLMRRVGAEQVLVLLQRLGFWVGGDRPVNEQRREFPRDLSKLDSDALGDHCSYWQSELSRVVAVIGALQARQLIAQFDVKRARNTATARLMREYRDRDEKLPSQSALAAEVAGCADVQSPEESLLTVEVAITALGAVKDALEGYTRVLSREISRRGDLLRAGVMR